ncbi:ABC transporter substrate-binding protein [Aliiglaciecola sp. LCG003]|uniref:MlaC/ttg2D family ABC transporter substrate-binding protein n=1 Tax=Aliiglaciecola sp. LCG003 TaxID=3053655 RepID=UPI002572AE93|nr:ABC transporter substrate-binding protein [Aliiglaciecola sp. LCG003]WJG08857.1 ABC transporter substrate-binding protein [Aliiglaciecola sp. LCG003]
MNKPFLVKIAALVLVLATSASTAFAKEISKDDPYAMVQDVATITFERIKNDQAKIKADPDVLRNIVKEELLPYVDYKFSAYKVLGKYVTKAPKEQLQEFVMVFREYLVTTYAVAMGYYDNQTVVFEPTSDFEDERDVTVRAIVKDPNRPDIKIAFKVRKDRKTNQWKAYDMIAEGISMLSSKQSEFESILRQQGIEVVIDLMKDKINKPITMDKAEGAN